MSPEQQQWLEPPQLPGYRVSRSTVQLTEEGRRMGCPEPQLGRTDAGDLAYWVRPIGWAAALRLRIEGLRGFFNAQPKHRQG